MKLLEIVDLFCGGGGTSEGARQACVDLDIQPRITGVNHCPIAIQTHSANHKEARHLCTNIDDVNPSDLYAEGGLHFMWASPECIFHSNARGGKPVNEQRRSSPWCVLRWAERLSPPIIMVENVKEFLNWGPCLRKRVRTIMRNKKTGSSRVVMKWGSVPDPKRKGETFIAWKNALESLGYKVDWRVLCAADYGDPTTRNRLFVQAVRGRRKTVWPERTHAPRDYIAQIKTEGHDLFGGGRALAPWVAAREIIDWDDPGISIFQRKKYGLPDLVENTLRRLLVGLERHGCRTFNLSQSSGGVARSTDDPVPTIVTKGKVSLTEPVVVKLRGTKDGQIKGSTQTVDEPVPTLTAGGGHVGLSQGYLLKFHGDHQGRKDGAQRVHSTDQPLPTVDTSNRMGVAQPFIVGTGGPSGAARPQPVDKPLGAVLCDNRKGVAQPYIVPFHNEREGQEPRTHSIDQPTPAITCGHTPAVASPYLLDVNHGGHDNRTHSVEQPLKTVTGKRGVAVASPFVVGTDHTGGNSNQVHSIDDSLTTVVTKQKHAVAKPWLIKFNKTGTACSTDEPLHTVTTKDRFGLCRAVITPPDGKTENLATLILPSGRGLVTTLKIAKYFAERVTGCDWSLDLPADFTEVLVDLLFRMLKWTELALAQGFPKDYQFHGSTEEIVKQIGNAVPPGLAKALFKAALTQSSEI